MHIEGAPSYSKVLRRTGDVRGRNGQRRKSFPDPRAFECSRLIVSAGAEEWRMD